MSTWPAPVRALGAEAPTRFSGRQHSAGAVTILCDWTALGAGGGGGLGFPGHIMTSVLLQMWVHGWHWVPKTQRTYWEDSQDSGHSCLNG